MANRPFSEMPNSAACRRPRSANASGSRNVIAIGGSLSEWYHYDTSCPPVPVNLRSHRYAAFLVVPVAKYTSSGVR